MRNRINRRLKVRGGFTLVELLVVIAIIAMLASMLLPAVQGARAAARKTQCINNHHNIGIALLRFEGDKNRYPGYANNQSGPGTTNTGWVFVVLPYLDRSDIFNTYGPSGTSPGGVPSEHLKIMVCPDDAESINNSTNASYVANSGNQGDDNTGTEAAAGVFTRQIKATATTLVKVTNSGSVTDGVATTLMVGENIDAQLWTSASEGDVGMCWVTGSTPSNTMKLNGATGTAAGTPRPSSFHAGGVVFTFCDGHTQFISEDIQYTVFQQLMTSRAAPFSQLPLSENSY